MHYIVYHLKILFNNKKMHNFLQKKYLNVIINQFMFLIYILIFYIYFLKQVLFWHYKIIFIIYIYTKNNLLIHILKKLRIFCNLLIDMFE